MMMCMHVYIHLSVCVCVCVSFFHPKRHVYVQVVCMCGRECAFHWCVDAVVTLRDCFTTNVKRDTGFIYRGTNMRLLFCCFLFLWNIALCACIYILSSFVCVLLCTWCEVNRKLERFLFCCF